MIETVDGTLLSLRELSQQLPIYRGLRLTPSRLVYYIQTGRKKPDGVRVYLAAQRIGNAWVVSIEAVRRFWAELTHEPTPAA